jgi:hypothetical protein
MTCRSSRSTRARSTAHNGLVPEFESPTGMTFNRGPVADPESFAREAEAASWLYLCSEEFASMENGMSYEQVEAAVPESINLVSDPPREMTMDLARQQADALDRLPRPTLVTCRTGPRSSALVDEVLARAEADGAPFAASEELKAWVRQGLEELRGD